MPTVTPIPYSFPYNRTGVGYTQFQFYSTGFTGTTAVTVTGPGGNVGGCTNIQIFSGGTHLVCRLPDSVVFSSWGACTWRVYNGATITHTGTGWVDPVVGIVSVTPTKGPAAGSGTDTYLTITLSGVGDVSGPYPRFYGGLPWNHASNTVQVMVGGVCTIVTKGNYTITCRLPAWPAGIVPVTVSFAWPDGWSGWTAYIDNAFTFTAGPTMTTVSPAQHSLVKATSPDYITIVGTDFAPVGGTYGTRVWVDSFEYSVTVISDTQLRLQWQNYSGGGHLSAGVKNIQIKSYGYTATVGTIEFVAGSVTSTVPSGVIKSTAPVEITLHGERLAALAGHTGYVQLRPTVGSPVDFTFVADGGDQVRFTLDPTGITGSCDLWVFPLATSSYLPSALQYHIVLTSLFNVNPPPSITSVVPNHGDMMGTTAIAFTGTDLYDPLEIHCKNLPALQATSVLGSLDGLTATATMPKSYDTGTPVYAFYDGEYGWDLGVSGGPWATFYFTWDPPTLAVFKIQTDDLAHQDTISQDGTHTITVWASWFALLSRGGASALVFAQKGSLLVEGTVHSIFPDTTTDPYSSKILVTFPEFSEYGTFDIVVSTWAGVATLAGALQVTEGAARITAVTPTEFSLARGGIFTIRGRNFDKISYTPQQRDSVHWWLPEETDPTAVMAGYVATSFVVSEDFTQAEVTMPAVPLAWMASPPADISLKLEVLTDAGPILSGAIAGQGIHLTSTDPGSTSLVGGAPILLLGTNLPPVGTGTQGSAPAYASIQVSAGTGSTYAASDEALVVDDTTIQFTMPALVTLPAGTATQIRVAYSARGAVPGAVLHQTVQAAVGPLLTAPPPTVTTFSPTSGAESGGTALTINGTFLYGPAYDTKVYFEYGTNTPVPGIIDQAKSSTTKLVVSTATPTAPWTNPIGAATIRITTVMGEVSPGSFHFDRGPDISSAAELYSGLQSGGPSGGYYIRLLGRDFIDVLSVTLGGVPSSDVQTLSDTEIRFLTPAGTPGQALIKVFTKDLGYSVRPVYFTFTSHDVPTITQVTPVGGPPLGGTTVRIIGTNFYHVQYVTFAGIPAEVQSISPEEIVCVTPQMTDASGTVEIEVKTEEWSAKGTYSILTLIVTDFSPKTGPVDGGTVVTITGLRFAGTVTVWIGGKQATGVSVNPAQDTITCTTAAGMNIGAQFVTVVSSTYGSATSPDSFTVTWVQLTVIGSAPNIGSRKGGTDLTITGTSFGGTLAVKVGDLDAYSITVSGTKDKIFCKTPASVAIPAQDIVVTSNYNGTATRAGAFTYLLPLGVSRLSPDHGLLSGGVVVTFYGTGFAPDMSVRFGAYSASSIVLISGTEFQCTTPVTPPGSEGPINVTVTCTVNGSIVLVAGYTLDPLPRPEVLTVTPSEGPMPGGTPIVIGGANFGGTVTVNIGGIPCTDVVVNPADDMITCLTGRSPTPGNKDVTVISSTNGIGTKLLGFYYSMPPVLTGISPASGSELGGTYVRIVGSGFSGAITVAIGGIDSGSVQANPEKTEITFVPAPQSPGTRDVVVTAGTGSSTMAEGYTHLPRTIPLPTLPYDMSSSSSSGITSVLPYLLVVTHVTTLLVRGHGFTSKMKVSLSNPSQVFTFTPTSVAEDLLTVSGFSVNYPGVYDVLVLDENNLVVAKKVSGLVVN